MKPLELNIPDEGLNVDGPEQYLTKGIEKFGKQVFGKALQEIEEKKLGEAKPRAALPSVFKLRANPAQIIPIFAIRMAVPLADGMGEGGAHCERCH